MKEDITKRIDALNDELATRQELGHVKAWVLEPNLRKDIKTGVKAKKLD